MKSKWTNHNGGDWETALNWSSGTIPGIADDAAIALNGIYTVAALADETVHSLSVAKGATLAIDEALIVTGTLNNAGTLDVNGGTLDVVGAVSGKGSVIIDGSGQVEFENARVSQNVAFNTGTGELILDSSHSYRGTISGFIQQDTLDLADIAFGAATSAIFSGTDAGGTLTVGDGLHTAKLTLVGDYLNSTFTASSDGHGGTLVVDPLVSTNIFRTPFTNTIIRSIAIDTIYESTFTNTSSGQVLSTGIADVDVQGVFTNSSFFSTLRAHDTSNINLESTLINSGHVIASGAADITVQSTVTNTGVIEAIDNGVVVLENAVTNTNFGQLEAAGHGVLTVGGNVTNISFIDALDSSEINLGIIANTNTITNRGTIQADDSSEVNINAGTFLFNQGTLEANNLATLNITASGFFTNSGTIEANNAGLVAITGFFLFNPGTVVANDVGTISISGNVTNSGVLKTNGGLVSVGGTVNGGEAQISGSGEIELHSGSNINVNFNSQAPVGTLRLDSSAAFNGHVSGFASGGGNSDTIDLAFIPYNGIDTHLTYTANAAGSAGILHVTDDNIAAQTIDIAMVGHYVPAEFQLSDDGHGGTFVHDFLLP